MKVTQTVKAWLPNDSMMSPDELTDQAQVQLQRLAYTNANMSEYGYTLIGDAEITLTLPERRQLIDAKVTAMRAEVKKIRGEAEAKANYIESQISNLLAIEHSPSSAAEHYEEMARQADRASRN